MYKWINGVTGIRLWSLCVTLYHLLSLDLPAIYIAYMRMPLQMQPITIVHKQQLEQASSS